MLRDAKRVMEGDAICVKCSGTCDTPAGRRGGDTDAEQARRLESGSRHTGEQTGLADRECVGRAGGRGELSVTTERRRRLGRRADAHRLGDSAEARRINEWIAIEVTVTMHPCDQRMTGCVIVGDDAEHIDRAHSSGGRSMEKSRQCVQHMGIRVN